MILPDVYKTLKEHVFCLVLINIHCDFFMIQLTCLVIIFNQSALLTEGKTNMQYEEKF